MLITVYLLVFVLGACLGSFYHVVGYRMPIEEDWVTSRSQCLICQKPLRFFKLIPVVSYLVQKGRCRTCGSEIKPIYFWIEVISGLLFVFPVYFYGLEEVGLILRAWTFLSLLIIITVSDSYYQLILNKVLLFFGVPLFIMQPNVIGAFVGFFMMYGLSLLGQFLFKKESIGGGDIKLYIIIGLVLGARLTILSLFIATIMALIYTLLLIRNKLKTISFGPFIAISGYVCLFYGELLIESYLSFIGA